MKIRGSSPFRQLGGTQAKKRAGKSKKSSFASSVESATAVSAVEANAPVDEVDSPVMDVMQQASQKYSEGEETLEEATKAVVESVIREHFGKKNLDQQEMDEISNVVSDSVSGDDALRGRLESILRRIANK